MCAGDPFFLLYVRNSEPLGVRNSFWGAVPLAWTSVLDTFMSRPQFLAGPSK